MQYDCIGYYYTEDNEMQLYWILLYRRQCNTIVLDNTMKKTMKNNCIGYYYTEDNAIQLY